jgi:hypothetical protein
MRIFPVLSIVTAIAALVLGASPCASRAEAGESASPAKIGSERESRAALRILSERCVSCHGPERKKAGLRLDDRAEALRGGDSGEAIVPGESKDSLLIDYVTGTSDVVMPPKGQRLAPAEVAVLKDWIDHGAAWPAVASTTARPAPPPRAHWSFQPVRRPPVPPARDPSRARNEIDAFLLDRLQRERLAPSPEADRATLIRRLSLDLVGLPPKASEVEAFLADERPDAYERLVDHLLESPHFGERWGRHWLDRARYADSSGCAEDLERPFAWRWRDWVIEAINGDLPFDRFTLAQIAGDLLPRATAEDIVATGFHRNAISNHEGGIDLEAERVKAVVDRTNAVGSAWLGLTLGCAECHSHKYDPISQQDYYRMFAFFNSVDDVDLGVPIRADAPEVSAARRELLDARARYLAGPAEGQREWESLVASLPAIWTVPEELESSSYRSRRHAILKHLEDGSLHATGRYGRNDSYLVVVPSVPATVTAIRVEALIDPDRPEIGPGRRGDHRARLTHFSVQAAPVSTPLALRPVEIASAEADFCEPGFSVIESLPPDGREDRGWAIDHTGVPHAAVFVAREPIGADGPSRIAVKLGHAFGDAAQFVRFRIAMTCAGEEQLAHQAVPEEIRTLASLPAASRTADAQAELKRYYQTVHRPHDPDLQAWNQALATSARVLSATGAQAIRERIHARPTCVHLRGDFRRPGTSVEPGVLAAVAPAQPPGRPLNRLDLARWIVDPANPLTSRVAVNDAWQRLFGSGLVRTPTDFGHQGDPPTHPELLDWLADEFVRSGWSRKALIRRIVCSATYRQSSANRRELVDRDPSNLLLARQNRIRLESEIIRDVILACGGLLSERVGGRGFHIPLPDAWTLSEAPSAAPGETPEDLHRRALYRIDRRNLPDSIMATFDAPESTSVCPQRVRSNTPLQALSLLNEPFAVEAARSLANATSRDQSEDPRATIRGLFLTCLSRHPSETELGTVEGLFREVAARYRDAPRDAATLLGRDATDPKLPEAAAWFVVARTILNLDELITRE